MCLIVQHKHFEKIQKYKSHWHERLLFSTIFGTLSDQENEKFDLLHFEYPISKEITELTPWNFVCYINYKKVRTILFSDKIASENKIVRNFWSPNFTTSENFACPIYKWFVNNFRNHGIFAFPRLRQTKISVFFLNKSKRHACLW